VTHEGVSPLLAGAGGIKYGIHTGSPAFGWAADHLEAAASTHNPEPGEREAYYNLCCLGTRAEILEGKAEGAVGFVIGKHALAGVIVDFDEADMQKMHLKEPLEVRVYGTGLELIDYPEVHLNSIDPDCLDAMDITEKDSKLYVPVAGIVPPELIGSGFGYNRPMGDVDFMSSDWNAIVENGLEALRLGDVVLIKDIDSSYGAAYKRGAASVGVITHGDSKFPGHGPGITTFMSSALPLLTPVPDKTANIKKYHDLAHGALRGLTI
jgi:hypothetical protein